MTTHFLSVEGLKKAYPGATTPVFEDIHFGIDKGELPGTGLRSIPVFRS